VGSFFCIFYNGVAYNTSNKKVILGRFHSGHIEANGSCISAAANITLEPTAVYKS
jgi:hypothetical protein